MIDSCALRLGSVGRNMIQQPNCLVVNALTVAQNQMTAVVSGELGLHCCTMGGHSDTPPILIYFKSIVTYSNFAQKDSVEIQLI